MTLESEFHYRWNAWTLFIEQLTASGLEVLLSEASQASSPDMSQWRYTVWTPIARARSHGPMTLGRVRNAQTRRAFDRPSSTSRCASWLEGLACAR